MSSEAERHIARRRDPTPPKLAAEWGVSVTQVYEYIASGELKAWNAAKKGAKKRDWRVRREWADEFYATRIVNGNAAA